MIDILFINPTDRTGLYQGLAEDLSAIEPPTWALLLAESVRSQGGVPFILDLNVEFLENEALKVRVNDLNPRLICFVVYGQNVNAGAANMSGAVKIANFLKKNTDYPISVIGSYVQALPVKCLKDEGSFDFGFTNEGVYALWNVLKLKSFTPGDLKKIKGIVFRDGNKIIMNEPEIVVPTERMDSDLPGYAWDLLPFKNRPLDLYRSPLWHAEYDPEKRSPYAAIQTSLGCNFGCAFCMINIINRSDNEEVGVASNYSRMRFWSPEFMIKQFDLLNQMGVETIKITDEMFLLHRKYYVPLCQELSSRSYANTLRMWAYSRIDTITNPEYLRLVRGAGIKWLALGIESANKSVRLEVSKGKFEDVDIRKVINQVHESGIEVMANYIVGLPGEKLSNMQETLDLSIELCTSGWNMYAATALPGSELYKKNLENGSQVPQKYLEYSFHSYESRPMGNENLSAKEVLAFRDMAFKRYHSHPNFIRRIKDKFSEKAVNSIESTLSINLERKILDD